MLPDNDRDGFAHIFTMHIYVVGPRDELLPDVPQGGKGFPYPVSYAADEGLLDLPSDEAAWDSRSFSHSSISAAENWLLPAPHVPHVDGWRGKRRAWLETLKAADALPAGPWAEKPCELYLKGKYASDGDGAGARKWTVRSIHHRIDRREVQLTDVKLVEHPSSTAGAMFVLDGRSSGTPSRKAVISVFPHQGGKANSWKAMVY